MEGGEGVEEGMKKNEDVLCTPTDCSQGMETGTNKNKHKPKQNKRYPEKC